MIEISFGKLVLLALVALIVLGPEKLPGAARTAGALLRRIRGGWDNVRAEVERELEIEEIKRAARDAATRAETLQNQLKEGVQQVHEPLDRMVNEAATMVRAEPAAIAETAENRDPVPGHDPEPDQMQTELPLGEPSAPVESPRNPPA